MVCVCVLRGGVVWVARVDFCVCVLCVCVCVRACVCLCVVWCGVHVDSPD